MIYSSIDNVQYGAILAKNIYNERGEVLLKKGAALTVGLLTRLRNVGVSAIYTEDDRFDDIVGEDIISEQTKREALGNIALALEKVQSGKDFDLRTVSVSANSLISEITKNKNVLISLNDIRTKDNQLFIHSLNITILAVLMGLKLNFNQLQLQELAIGAMLHDVGMVAKNTEKNDHPIVGFGILKKKHEISMLSAHVALQHHEHIDGTGYPRGVKEADIPIYARIVAIADYYDRRVAEENVRPYEVCEEIMASAGKMFTLDLVVLFLKSVALYPTGCWVRLTTGETGVVIAQNQGLPARPKIRLLKSKMSSSFDEEVILAQDTEVIDIDLAKSNTIFIQSIINE